MTDHPTDPDGSPPPSAGGAGGTDASGDPTAEAGAEGLVGTVLAGRYRILRLLGEGAMGAVYLGEHLKFGRKDAIKVLQTSMARDPEATRRFLRGARNVSAINHPHVCTVYDFSATEDGLQFLAMEYVDGETLADTLQREGALPASRAARIVGQVAAALQAAHDLGIVHRDLKPGNVMLARDRDGRDLVKVVDFDIAKGSREGEGSEVTRLGFVVGTPEYMSPEQLTGDPLDGRSDVYSLGLVFFRLLTGKLPVRASSTQDLLVERLTEDPLTLEEVAPGRELPPALQPVLDRALQRRRDDRYPTATAFADALRRALAGGAAERAAADPRARPPGREPGADPPSVPGGPGQATPPAGTRAAGAGATFVGPSAGGGPDGPTGHGGAPAGSAGRGETPDGPGGPATPDVPATRVADAGRVPPTGGGPGTGGAGPKRYVAWGLGAVGVVALAWAGWAAFAGGNGDAAPPADPAQETATSTTAVDSDPGDASETGPPAADSAGIPPAERTVTGDPPTDPPARQDAETGRVTPPFLPSEAREAARRQLARLNDTTPASLQTAADTSEMIVAMQEAPAEARFWAAFVLTQVSLAQGDTTRAIGWLEQGLQIDPSQENARQLLQRLRGGGP